MSITKLEQQIEAMRQEAFADGYATAMKEIKELTSRTTASVGEARVQTGNGSGSGQAVATGTSALGRRRHTNASYRATSGGRSAARRPQRGTNAVLVAEVLKSAAPRALHQADIRRALQDNGKAISFPSIGYSLRQLAARNAARQVGNSKTWRYLEA